jgi:hypothetical protein
VTPEGAPDNADGTGAAGGAGEAGGTGVTDARGGTDATEATYVTRLSSRRVAHAGDTLRLPGRGGRADGPRPDDPAPGRAAHIPDPAALRDARPPRSADPVRVERAAPAPRAAQPPQDGAALARAQRSRALRRALWLAVSVVLVVAVAATLLVVVLAMPR